MAVSDRRCNIGYACGDTCISKKKVCLKKLGTNRSKVIAKRFIEAIKLVDAKPKEEPDLVSDV